MNEFCIKQPRQETDVASSGAEAINKMATLDVKIL